VELVDDEPVLFTTTGFKATKSIDCGFTEFVIVVLVEVVLACCEMSAAAIPAVVCTGRAEL
jgi:hypothetical protein